jgi:hypothetical protein
MMKRLLPLALLLAAACSKPAAGPAYELAVSYGGTGYLLLSVSEEGKPEETSYYWPDGGRQEWQVFWGDQPPRFPSDGRGSMTKVLKNPFIIRSKGGELQVAAVKHKLDEGELYLKKVRSGPDGAPLLDYGTKEAGPGDAPAKTLPAEGFTRVRALRFTPPAKDLM